MSEPQPGTFAPENVTPGRILAVARAERGLSVGEVAQRLKFSARQIDALEADRYEALPSATFVRGMVRGYAKLLGIDATPLLGSLPREVVAGEVAMQPQGMSVPFPANRRSGSRVYLLLSMLIVVAVAVIVAEWFIKSQRVAVPVPVAPQASVEPAAPPAREPVQTAVPTPPAAAQIGPQAAPRPAADSREVAAARVQRAAGPTLSGRSRVELSFENESWVEIRNSSGEVIFAALNPAGSHKVIAGVAPLSIVIGSASGVQLSFNDAQVDLAPYTRSDVARLTLE